MRKLWFAETITAFEPAWKYCIVRQVPITSEEEVAVRDSALQKKRTEIKAMLRLKHLRRKARRASRADTRTLCLRTRIFRTRLIRVVVFTS